MPYTTVPYGRYHGAEIARRVADVHVLRRRLVDLHVGDVIDRRRRRDRVDHRRHRRRDAPRPRDLRGREPYAGDDRVVRIGRHLDHRLRRVRDVREWRPLDRRVLRRTVEIRRERRAILERHRRRLRNRIGDHRLLRLRRPSDGRKHRARERMRRNAREVGRQRIAGDERPRTGDPRRAEPAAGHQHVVVVVAGVDQHVARRVRRPQQLRADNRHEVGLALEHDQLGRDLARVDRRHAIGERGLRVGLGASVQQVDSAGRRQRLRDRVERALDERSDEPLRPRTADRARLQPPVVDVDVIGAACAVLQDQRPRIDHALRPRMSGTGFNTGAPSIGTRIAGE